MQARPAACVRTSRTNSTWLPISLIRRRLFELPLQISACLEAICGSDGFASLVLISSQASPGPCALLHPKERSESFPTTLRHAMLRLGQPTMLVHRSKNLRPSNFWFVNRLTIEFKNERWMSAFKQVALDVLMTGDARVRAHVKISQVVHAGADAHRVRPIGASVSAKPRLGRAVTTFARDAFVGTRARCQASLSNRLKR